MRIFMTEQLGFFLKQASQLPVVSVMCTVREEQAAARGRAGGMAMWFWMVGLACLKRTASYQVGGGGEEMGEAMVAARLLAEAAGVLLCTRSQRSVQCSK